MPPSAPIDSDIYGTTIYVLESTALWKGEPVGAGNAAWTQILDAATFAADLPELQFSRVRLPPGGTGGPIYVLGSTEDALVMLKSGSGGLTWTYSQILTASFTTLPFTVTEAFGVGTAPDGTEIIWADTHERIGDDENTHNPWAVAMVVDAGVAKPWTFLRNDQPNPIMPDIFGSNVEEWGSTWHVIVNNALSEAEKAYTYAYMETMHPGYASFGSSMYTSMPKEANRTKFWYSRNHHGGTVYSHTKVYWHKPYRQIPAAFDISRTNPGWMYVGTTEKIVKSEDGGISWKPYLDDQGANDICVDPRLAGAIYTWRTDGALQLIVNGAVNATLDTETPIQKPLRIARDLNSGRLYTLKGGSEFRVRNLGSWTTLAGSLAGATGLHAYEGGKLIFTEAGNIYISDDYGATITGKKGGWSGYSAGINGHRIIT